MTACGPVSRDGMAELMRAPGVPDARGADAIPTVRPATGRWQPRIVGDAYSRRVAFLKRLLPAIGIGLLLLVGAWPRLRPLLDSVRLTLPSIARRDARELQMIGPRYAGVDRLHRPFVLTAAAARQMPGQSDLMSLVRPRGKLILRNGARVDLTAATGVYQTQAKMLDLFGDVTLTHQNGTRFVTQAAHLDLAAETASGHDSVSGRGPSGSIKAEGFRILDKGDTVFFTGRSHLLLKRIAAGRAAPPPPALPAGIERTSDRLAAAALATRTEETRARPANHSRSAEKPDQAALPVTKRPAVQASGSGHHAE
jgi:lipopolysaccharide export system protein LptC